MKEIFERVSVRQYAQEPVPDEMVTRLLKAAMAAPSARNAQPWEFIVVKDRQMLKKMSVVSDYTHMLEYAGAGFVVLGDLRISEKEYILQDCSAAVENLLLEAESLGLGGCWLGVCPRQSRMETVRELFELPEHILPVCLVSVGFPEKKPAPKEKFDERKVHYERY